MGNLTDWNNPDATLRKSASLRHPSRAEAPIGCGPQGTPPSPSVLKTSSESKFRSLRMRPANRQADMKHSVKARFASTQRSHGNNLYEYFMRPHHFPYT